MDATAERPAQRLLLSIDWFGKLRRLLQTLAFCLAISAIHYALLPHRTYSVPLVYSLAIGVSIWALVDFGRHLCPSSSEFGWPAGIGGLLLPMAGISGGFLSGTLLADWWFGWSSWNDPDSRWLRASVITTLLAGTAATYFFRSRGRSAYLQHRMEEAQQQAAQARLKLLESQLEPHMLFNTLANLRALIGTDPSRAQQMLDRMIGYLRATLGASRTTMHSLQAEFDRLRDYLELMAVRMGPRLSYELDLPAALATQPIPALLLQPLVENAIRHGLEPKVGPGQLRVRARRDAADMVVEVFDDGAGPNASFAPEGSGFGLTQVCERLQTLHGARASLELQPGPDGGTVARVRLPAAP